MSTIPLSVVMNEMRYELKEALTPSSFGPQPKTMGPLDRLIAAVKEAFASFKEKFKSSTPRVSSDALVFEDTVSIQQPTLEERIAASQRNVKSLQKRVNNLTKEVQNTFVKIQNEKNALQNMRFQQTESIQRNDIEDDFAKELAALSLAEKESRVAALTKAMAREESTESLVRGDVSAEEGNAFEALQKEFIQKEFEIAKKDLLSATNRVNTLGAKLLALSPPATTAEAPKKGLSRAFKMALAAMVVSTVAYGVATKYSSKIEENLSKILKPEQMNLVKTYATQLQAKMSSGQKISMEAVNAFVDQLKMKAEQANQLASVYGPAIKEYGLTKFAALKSIDLSLVKEFGAKVVSQVEASLSTTAEKMKTDGQEVLLKARFFGEGLTTAAKTTGNVVADSIRKNPRKAAGFAAGIPLVGSAVIAGSLLRKKFAQPMPANPLDDETVFSS